MNKNFIKAASLSLGLVVASLSLAGCNMAAERIRETVQPGKTHSS